MATAVDGRVIVVARAGDTSRKALSTVINDVDAQAAGEFGGGGVEWRGSIAFRSGAGYYCYYGHYSKYYKPRA